MLAIQFRARHQCRLPYPKRAAAITYTSRLMQGTRYYPKLHSILSRLIPSDIDIRDSEKPPWDPDAHLQILTLMGQSKPLVRFLRDRICPILRWHLPRGHDEFRLFRIRSSSLYSLRTAYHTRRQAHLDLKCDTEQCVLGPDCPIRKIVYDQLLSSRFQESWHWVISGNHQNQNGRSP